MTNTLNLNWIKTVSKQNQKKQTSVKLPCSTARWKWAISVARRAVLYMTKDPGDTQTPSSDTPPHTSTFNWNRSISVFTHIGKYVCSQTSFKKEMDSIQNEWLRVINISWDNLFRIQL